MLAACHGKHGAAHPHSDGASCKDVAVRGETLIAQAPPAQAEATTRFVASMIDLCQAPGLSVAARACLAGAASLDAARDCPSVPAIADDSGVPSCRQAVDHAMEVLQDDQELRTSDVESERGERQSYLDQCRQLNPKGVRCMIAGRTVDEIDKCADDHENQRTPRPDEDDEDGYE